MLSNIGEKLGTSLLEEEEQEKPIEFKNVQKLLEAIMYP